MGQKENLLGKRFGRLFVIAEHEHIGVKKKAPAWLCQCECGSEPKAIKAEYLKNGDTKSCGCLNEEVRKENYKKAYAAVTKYLPVETSARRVWLNRYASDGLSFEDFYKLAQQPCVYCLLSESKSFNQAMFGPYSDNAKENGWFKYNGLDRVDSNGKHTIDNVVPCCWECNIAKRERTVDEFKMWAFDIHEVFILGKVVKTMVPNIHRSENPRKTKYHPIDTTAKKVWSKRYREMAFEDFLQLSQQCCFYCGVLPSNRQNIYATDKKASEFARNNGWFVYNGIDRLDSTKDHSDPTNCVPCCKWCNYAKSNKPLEEFRAHIIRLHNGLMGIFTHTH